MKKKFIFTLLCGTLLLSGCSSSEEPAEASSDISNYSEDISSNSLVSDDTIPFSCTCNALISTMSESLIQYNLSVQNVANNKVEESGEVITTVFIGDGSSEQEIVNIISDYEGYVEYINVINDSDQEMFESIVMSIIGSINPYGDTESIIEQLEIRKGTNSIEDSKIITENGIVFSYISNQFGVERSKENPNEYNVDMNFYQNIPETTSTPTPTATPTPSADPTSTAESTPEIPVEYLNALSKARDYLDFTAFSYTGLIDQLEYEGYSAEACTYAADNCGADWNQQALEKAQSYLDFSAFSYSGLNDQLEYEGFTVEQTTYAVDNCGADWNEQAALKAQEYLDVMSFSRQGLIDQLIYEGFTTEQAEYGVSAVGY